MSDLDKITVRACNHEEAKSLLDFIDREHMDYSVYEYEAFLRQDPNTFIVAVDESGQPLGFGGVTIYPCDLVQIHSFIVRHDLRRKGIGRQLWKAMIQLAGDRNIFLDGVSTMANWYRGQGFIHETTTVRFCSITITEELKKAHRSKYDIAPLSEEMWPSFMNYDRQVYPNYDREQVLRLWFTDKRVRVAVAFDDGKIVGYGSIHEKPGGQYGLRNVFADNEEILEALLRDMFENVKGHPEVHFMVLEGNPVPNVLKTSVDHQATAVRLFTKHKIETINDKVWLPTAHFL